MPLAKLAKQSLLNLSKRFLKSINALRIIKLRSNEASHNATNFSMGMAK